MTASRPQVVGVRGMHSYCCLAVTSALRKLGHVFDEGGCREDVLEVAFFVLELDSLGLHNRADCVSLALFSEAVVWQVIVLDEQRDSSVDSSRRPSSGEMLLHLQSHLVFLAILILIE